MKIGENLSNSFSFATDALSGRWIRWIMLVIASFVFPIMYGYTIRIMRGIEPAYEEESFFSLFIDGFKLFIIYIAYMIIPLIALIGTFAYAIINIASIGKHFSIITYLPVFEAAFVGLIITIILFFIAMLLCVIGSVRFARTECMGEAFALGEILATIRKIGWGNYILSLIGLFIVVIIIVLVITVVEIVLAFIPILGWIAGFILNLFLGPFLSIMVSRYYSLLYDEAVVEGEGI